MDSSLLDKNYIFEKVYQPLNISAALKSKHEDFIVEENISIAFAGEGEHCWVYIQKSGCNTDWLAQQLAAFCGVKRMAVSYAGLKDRHAVTSQWFSVQLPGKPTPDWKQFERDCGAVMEASETNENIRVLKSFRHNKKLQRGALKNNYFKITLRHLSDNSDLAFQQLTQRCNAIAGKGVANYFGRQRFGRDFSNLEQAMKLFANPRYKLSKQKRGMYLSAARSWMFNHILSDRIKQNKWDSAIPGDVFMLNGRSACFPDDGDEQSTERLVKKEIHPTAILWGEGDVMVTSQAAELESRIIDQFPLYRDGLVAARLKAQRRACRLMPQQLESYREEDNFIVTFSLPAGSYATMVLAEIFSDLSESSAA